MKSSDAIEHFMSKISPEPNSGCWLWVSSLDEKGYGLLWHNGRTRKAHRVGHELLVGPIPKGLELDHLCRVRCCVNPKHLEAVTHAVNMSRGSRASKTKCPKGHIYVGENLYVNSKGQRWCRECGRMNQRAAKLLRRQRLKEIGEAVPVPNAAKICCPKGHPYSGENLYVRPDGGRDCRECHRGRLKKYRHQQAFGGRHGC